ncbi:MAG: UDP-N-acetylmuramate--L-alanine ligase [Candidatus Pacebacteria bacterium]|nr:UDP-N-acetylmuramate--L-alanine ligase [Candidatus Paceibacterota bacterium]
MDIGSIKKIHCIGIGGIGVSAIARFFRSRGAEVSGTDAVESDETSDLRKEGVVVATPHGKEYVPQDADVIIYSPAIPDDNEEIIYAREHNIQILSYPEALGRITEYFTSITVSGTNGKTTTTAILGKMLEAGEKDPTVIVGGKVPGWDKNLRLGGSDIFVAEACEYKRAMLNMSPHIIVLTNIEEDHLDYYKDIDDITDAFVEYVAKLNEDDLLVYNADDPYSKMVANTAMSRMVSYGLSDNSDIQAKDIVVKGGTQTFSLVVYGEKKGKLTTHVPGVFNIYNILAGVAVSLDMGVTLEQIQKALDNYSGIWRRFEKVGEFNDVVIISDYGHHPRAIKNTLLAAREYYPGKKVLVVFQPHHRDRTAKLFDDFVRSFTDADEVILSEIYHVEGREDTGPEISSKDLVRAIENEGGVDMISYAKDLETTEKMIRKKAKDFGVVLIMGAGNIDGVARNLVD